MPAKRLTTALFAAAALTAAAGPAAQAAPTTAEPRPACMPTGKMACHWACAPQARVYCADDQADMATRARAAKAMRPVPRPAHFDTPRLVTPQNGCRTAVGAAAPC